MNYVSYTAWNINHQTGQENTIMKPEKQRYDAKSGIKCLCCKSPVVSNCLGLYEGSDHLHVATALIILSLTVSQIFDRPHG